MFVLVRGAVPSGVDPVNVEIEFRFETVVENVDHHLGGLIAAARRERDDRGANVPFRVTGRVVLDHKAMNDRFELGARLIDAFSKENRRLQERLVRLELETGLHHADLNVERAVLVRKLGGPASGPPNREEPAVSLVDVRLNKGRDFVRGSSARGREGRLLRGRQGLGIRFEIDRRAGGAAQEVEGNRRVGRGRRQTRREDL